MKPKRESYLAVLSASGGILSGMAWLPFCPGVVLLISFIPFFLIADELYPDDNRFGNRLPFILLLPGFVAFNIIAIAWIRIAGTPLLVTAIIANSFIMTFTFWIALIVKRKAGRAVGNIPVIIIWMAMEYATNNIPLLSPWLNLGNGLAGEPSLVQWYEFTGVAGGTLWILIVNMLLAKAIRLLKNGQVSNKVVSSMVAILPIMILPPVLSLLLLHDRLRNPGEGSTEVVVIQPNIDPYTDKFTIPFHQQLEQILADASSVITDQTAWIITPETTIDDPVNLSETDSDKYIAEITNFINANNVPAFILGAVTFSPGPPYRLHNSALMITHDQQVKSYHKSKLVPGIERTLGGSHSFLQRIFPELGGTSGGYHGQSSPSLLVNPIDTTIAAPVICFESAFGDHVAGFVRLGADFIVVITNDGWWRGTQGYYQHLTFSSLRAIENRRYVVRAANTGVSAIVDPGGRITDSLPWWEKGTLNHSVGISGKLTFYTKHGDLLGRTSATLALFLMLLHLLAYPLRKRVSKKPAR